LRKVDLNLLRLFEALYEVRSVTRAAERLFVTPSAVSHGLGRLRELVNDDVFVKKTDGMIPTPRAHEMARRLRILLPQLFDVLSPPDFDPLTSERTFTLAVIPSLLLVLMPHLAAKMTTMAPNVTLKTQRLESAGVDDLDCGRLDAAIGHFQRKPPHFIETDLISDTYVWVLTSKSPFRDTVLDSKALSRIPHIDLRIESSPYRDDRSINIRHGLELIVHNSIASVEREMLADGFQRQVRYYAPDALSGMCIAARTGAVCLVPNMIAQQYCKSLGLSVRKADFPDMELRLQMLTHAEFGRNPAVRWLTGLIAAAVSENLLS
jgi:DNA-binding transcriptional LysR family regulator